MLMLLLREMNDDAMAKFEHSAAELNMTDKGNTKHISFV